MNGIDGGPVVQARALLVHHHQIAARQIGHHGLGFQNAAQKTHLHEHDGHGHRHAGPGAQRRQRLKAKRRSPKPQRWAANSWVALKRSCSPWREIQPAHFAANRQRTPSGRLSASVNKARRHRPAKYGGPPPPRRSGTWQARFQEPIWPRPWIPRSPYGPAAPRRQVSRR